MPLTPHRKLRPSQEREINHLGFADILTQEQEYKNQFIRYLSNGRLPTEEKKPKEPEIPEEELHRRRLEQIERETYQKAFAAGEKAGLEMAEHKMRILLKQVENFLGRLDGLPNQIFMEAVTVAEQTMVETAILLVRELHGHELRTNPEGIVERIRQVLAEAAGQVKTALHLSPADARLLASLPEFKDLQLVADPAIAQGSVRLETGFGALENDLERQLARIEQEIRTYLHGRLSEQPDSPE